MSSKNTLMTEEEVRATISKVFAEERARPPAYTVWLEDGWLGWRSYEFDTLREAIAFGEEQERDEGFYYHISRSISPEEYEAALK